MGTGRWEGFVFILVVVIAVVIPVAIILDAGQFNYFLGVMLSRGIP